jgi:Ribbon-helix-helix protein, copG family.
MARQKKDSIKVTYYIDREVAGKLDDYSEATGVPKSVVVERAIKDYIDKCNKKDGSKQ